MFIPYSIQLPTPYGSFIMYRHDRCQPHAILQTGRPHIDREIQLLQVLADSLPVGAVALDAGANIGLIAVPLAQRLAPRGGTVLAFEPQRLVYYMLAGNTALAGLENLVCHRLALGAEDGSARIPVLDPHHEADFGQVSLLAGEPEGDLVPVARIDDLGLTRLDLIKIDVEHMELAVLAGAEASIAAFRPVIWIEVWPQQHAAVLAWMSERNYVMTIVDELNFCAIPAERRSGFPLEFPLFNGRNHPLVAVEPA